MREGSAYQGVESSGSLSELPPLVITAAHELKSPLALIRQLALGIEQGECPYEEVVRIARQITLTSERALRLTANLTKTARLEDSLFAVEPLNPSILCEEVVGELSPLFRERKRHLKTTVTCKGRLLGLANRDLLRRVLLGFLDNALHYTEPESTVVLGVSTHHRGACIRLSVRDYGPALPADAWKRIEAAMGGASLPLHSRPESSGLGVYIARQFAEAMRGTIGAIRHRDGVSFYIDISASTQMKLL